MFNRFLDGGYDEEFLRKKITERVRSGDDGPSRVLLRRSLVFKIGLFGLGAPSFPRLFACEPGMGRTLAAALLAIATIALFVGTIIEIRDRWRYSQVCIAMLREQRRDGANRVGND